MSEILSLIIPLLLIFVIISIVWWSYRNGISPMPTSRKVKQAFLEALPPGIEGTIYDLGSGWGTLVIPLAKRYPNAQLIGIENSPIPYYVSLLRKKPKNLQLIKKDFFAISLRNAKMITCYLYPGAMKKLQDKFDCELREGTWVISHTFALPNWQPIKIIVVDDLYHTTIYLYCKGKNHG